ncbi:hypothetical protein EV207_108147, partial [Scopulibacillus darangshiensis]
RRAHAEDAMIIELDAEIPEEDADVTTEDAEPMPKTQ